MPDVSGRDHGKPRIPLSSVVEFSFLKKPIFSGLLERQRETRITRIPLVRDPAEYLALEADLANELRSIGQRAMAGQWNARPAVVIRAEKRAGIHRPLSYLAIEDAILLKALSASTQASFHERLPKWVSFGRGDPLATKRSKPKEDSQQRAKRQKLDDPAVPQPTWWPYGGGFQEWLRYMGLLEVIRGNEDEFVVLSDITDFYPSVSLELLRDMLNIRSNLSLRAVDLLMTILSNVRPRMFTFPDDRHGLPQESSDAARFLAHGFLLELDLELHREGVAQRYTRWADDVAVSVSNEKDGYLVIARIQKALGLIGLRPSADKTRLVPKIDFAREHWPKDNNFLDRIEADRKANKSVDKRDFHAVGPQNSDRVPLAPHRGPCDPPVVDRRPRCERCSPCSSGRSAAWGAHDGTCCWRTSPSATNWRCASVGRG